MLRHTKSVCCGIEGQYVAALRVSMLRHTRSVCCGIEGQYVATYRVRMLQHTGSVCWSTSRADWFNIMSPALSHPRLWSQYQKLVVSYQPLLVHVLI